MATIASILAAKNKAVEVVHTQRFEGAKNEVLLSKKVIPMTLEEVEKAFIPAYPFPVDDYSHNERESVYKMEDNTRFTVKRL